MKEVEQISKGGKNMSEINENGLNLTNIPVGLESNNSIILTPSTSPTFETLQIPNTTLSPTTAPTSGIFFKSPSISPSMMTSSTSHPALAKSSNTTSMVLPPSLSVLPSLVPSDTKIVFSSPNISHASTTVETNSSLSSNNTTLLNETSVASEVNISRPTQAGSSNGNTTTSVPSNTSNASIVDSLNWTPIVDFSSNVNLSQPVVEVHTPNRQREHMVPVSSNSTEQTSSTNTHEESETVSTLV